MNDFVNRRDGKITERAFNRGLLISVFNILLCIIFLCSITYAWFLCEVTSNSNKLISGSFDISVSVIKTCEADGTLIENGVAITASQNGSYKLSTPGAYTVTLSPTDDTNVKGYCIITVDNSKRYKTNVILNSETVNERFTEITAPLSFKIITNKIDTTVRFDPHWGVPAKHDIDEGAVIGVTDTFVENENAVESE